MIKKIRYWLSGLDWGYIFWSLLIWLIGLIEGMYLSHKHGYCFFQDEYWKNYLQQLDDDEQNFFKDKQ